MVSDSNTELKTKKVSSSIANYSIMFVKSLLMPFQFIEFQVEQDILMTMYQLMLMVLRSLPFCVLKTGA